MSDSRETLNTTLMRVLLTMISLKVSGTAEANVHSSSSLAAEVELWARFEVGAGMAPPRRSTEPDAGGWDLMDC